jgi:hypothetical protein
MLNAKILRKTIATVTAIAVWSVYSMVAMAQVPRASGEIVVSGQVTVNGQSAVSNSTIVSGSAINTSANSTAVINLGKVGKVELQPESSLTLKFSDTSISGVLESGKVRVMSFSGASAVISTKHGIAIGDTAQANTFVVDVECSHTHVDSVAGLVILRTGTDDKQVAAGTDAIAGSLSQTGCKPCPRPGTGTTAPVPTTGLGAGAILGILLALGGVVGTGVVLGTSGGTTISSGGGTTVVSPTR